MRTKRKKPCIYQILCLPTGKFYVGSTDYLPSRRNSHLYELRHKVHKNTHLQRAYDKYGEQAFVFVVIEAVDSKARFAREQHWIDKLHATDPSIGFNIMPIAAEFGERPRYSPDVIEKMRISRTGKRATLQARQRISLAQKRLVTPERIALFRAHMESPEAAAKRAAKRALQPPPSAETRAKIGAATRSRPTYVRNTEHQELMSDVKKREWDEIREDPQRMLERRQRMSDGWRKALAEHPPVIIPCTIDGCGRKHYAHGLCKKHYHRLWAKAHEADESLPVCKLEGCIERVYAKSLCKRHYRQALRERA